MCLSVLTPFPWNRARYHHVYRPLEVITHVAPRWPGTPSVDGAFTESYGAIPHLPLFHDSNGTSMIVSRPRDVPSLELDPSRPPSMVVAQPRDVPSLELDPSHAIRTDCASSASCRI